MQFPDIKVSVSNNQNKSSNKPTFLKVDSSTYSITYPDNTNAEVVYDTIDRKFSDASVIIAWTRVNGEKYIYLRSCIRIPLVKREESCQLWEVAAGLIEGDEDPREAAARETLEELGFDVPARQFNQLGLPTLPTPGIIAEKFYIYEVYVDPWLRKEPVLDGSPLEKFGSVICVPLNKIQEYLDKGLIVDSKTELAYHRLMAKFKF